MREAGNSMRDMNCLAFEKIVVDLARELPMDAASKQGGLAHAQSCVRCAGRLKTEQGLSRSLRAVAKGDHLLSASSALESSLLAAFRQRNEMSPVAANVTVPTFTDSPLKRFFASFKWAFAPAAAVAAILLIAFVVVRALQPTAPSNPGVANGETPAPPAPSQPEQIKVPLPESEPEEQVAVAGRPNPPRLTTPIKHQAVRTAPRRRTDRVTVEIGEFRVDEPEAVSAKDFLVFDYAQTLPPADSVQLMRVRLPRERLAPLGIPLPSNARNENFVNADFLVGSDGVPRAIRVANR
jgi:hypothetical protein